ncbi:hypothetical protein [Petroclostridium xylanilyticum]|jgi:hypothetical protein|uniref:hypothetical protein n=1 Tax=Petroclostridium xylanilyticum TaxID=1792311 RepID=UPI0018E3D703|nr:hypothetical protein [Petroclostridium xylanilyticum]
MKASLKGGKDIKGTGLLTPLFRDDILRNGGVLAWQDMHEKKAAVGYIILC